MESISEAKARLAGVYDPARFADSAGQFSKILSSHLSRVLRGEGPVLPWTPPARQIAEASESLAGNQESDLPDRFEEILNQMLSRGINLHHSRYIGHQVAAPVPVAGLFDAIGATTNQAMAIYEMGPWSTAVENALVREMGSRVGWEADQFAGLITHGGSLANLTALLTARNVALPTGWETGLSKTEKAPVLVANGEVHYSVTRAAGLLGLGTHNVVRVPVDQSRRMTPEALDNTLTDLKDRQVPVIAVTACACSTLIGAFDPIREIAAVCEKHETWFHVDAAHGGGALFSEKHRHLLDGLELADSVIIDAHKMMFVPGLCAFVLYKNKEHRFEAFRQDAPYLFDPTAPDLADFDMGMKTIECTKRAAGFGLWGIWSLYGSQLFADLIDVTFAAARQLYEKLRDAPDFEPIHEPESNIVAFRHTPAHLQNARPDELGDHQLQLRRRLIESGKFYIVSTKIDGVGALRAVLMNPLTTGDDLDALLASIRTI